jgi:hypothetical protein
MQAPTMFHIRFKNVRKDLRHKRTADRANVFKSGVTLPDRYEASLAAIKPCRMQLLIAVGNLAGKQSVPPFICQNYNMKGQFRLTKSYLKKTREATLTVTQFWVI